MLVIKVFTHKAEELQQEICYILWSTTLQVLILAMSIEFPLNVVFNSSPLLLKLSDYPHKL